MGKNNKFIYLAPDVDISKNEGAKAHVLGEIKYLQKYYDEILLISQNTRKVEINKEIFNKVKFLKIPDILHKPFFRIIFENIFFVFLSIFLRSKGYLYLIERSYRLGGVFSIIFNIFGGRSIYQLNEPIYYEKIIMLFQNIILHIMGFFDIKFFGTHNSFSYNIQNGKYINGWWGVDSDIINKKNNISKVYDVIYVGSAASWHNFEIIFSTAKKLFDKKFIIIISGEISDYLSLLNKDKISNIEIINNISNSQIFDFIKKSKIGLALYDINNNVLEKFGYYYSPIKVHEYKACGLPVIATRIGNINELVKNCGLLINNNDNDLENAIKQLLNNEELYNNFSKNGINEIIEKYNWDFIAKWYFNLLK